MNIAPPAQPVRTSDGGRFVLDTLLIVVGVFVIAFLFAPVGMGGGMLFAPLLHYVADWPIDETLLAVSLVLTWSVSIGSGLRHRKEGIFDDTATKSALWGAILGAILGVAIVNALGDDLDAVFKVLSVAMLVWALRKTAKKMNTAPETESEEPEPSVGTIQHLPLRMGAGVGGALSSVLGVGAGVIYVPVLQQSANLDPRRSIGSSLNIMMVVVPIAILALLSTSPSGLMGTLGEQAAWFYALPFVAYLGATSGAKFGLKHISTKNIMTVFMVLVAVVLVRYVIDVAGIML
jgi:uncharacterized membrane protein YfcA